LPLLYIVINQYYNYLNILSVGPANCRLCSRVFFLTLPTLFAVTSSGMPRADVARGGLQAPPTPGRLGYLVADELMGWTELAHAVFWDQSFEFEFVYYFRSADVKNLSRYLEQGFNLSDQGDLDSQAKLFPGSS
jgi:hypothetical protein